MLRATNSDDELAAILSHEFGHFIADHNREDFHQSCFLSRLLFFWGPVAIPVAHMVSIIQELFHLPGAGMLSPTLHMAAYLAYKSRWKADEADHIGLLFATHAGYDPKAAISVYETLSA